MAKQNDADFIYVTYIKTTPEKLWQALISPEFTKQYWFNTVITTDWKVGSPLKYVMGGDRVAMEGKVLTFDPPRVLAYTFHDTHGEASSEPPTKVTLTIEPEKGTETVCLTVVHTDFVADSKHRKSISQGWPAVLSGLKSVLETGKALQFEG